MKTNILSLSETVMKLKTISLFILFSINISYSATYYINSLEGNDKNSGKSASSSWKSLEKVNDYYFQPGDIVRLKAGSRFIASEPLLSKNNLTFNSYGDGPKPIIDGNKNHFCVKFDESKNVKFINIKFVNGLPSNINLWKCNHISFESCNIDSSKGANIHNCNIYSGEGSNLTVRNSTLNYGEQTSRTGNLGIYIDGTENTLLEYDTILGNFSNIRIGFGNAPKYDYTDNLVVRYCVIKYGKYDNIDDDGSRNAQFYYNIFESENSPGYHDNVYIFSDGSGKFNQYSAVGSKYYNNTFISHSNGCAFEVRSNVVATDIIIKNNIFYNTDQSGWMFYSDNTYGKWTFDNNLYYMKGGSYNHYWHIKSVTMKDFSYWKEFGYDANSKCGDPLFSNYEKGDYSLGNRSPALSSGASVGLNKDIRGKSVPKNSPDIGAYQHSQ